MQVSSKTYKIIKNFKTIHTFYVYVFNCIKFRTYNHVGPKNVSQIIMFNSIWLFEQEHVNSEHGEGRVVAPLILYDDKTSLSNSGKVSGHPIYFSIANISCKDRYLREVHC